MNYKKVIGYTMVSIPFAGLVAFISILSDWWVGIAIVGSAVTIALLVLIGQSLIEGR